MSTTYTIENLPKNGDTIIDSIISINKYNDGFYDVDCWIELENFGSVHIPLDIEQSVLSGKDFDTSEMSVEEFEKRIQNDEK